jgi:ABC-type multidrug transport system ATPase subunit
MFAANIRLKGISDEQKKKKVEFLLSDLGLNNCADTFVGGSLIRGVSGGERKRTSIGVELLTNPSLIFLDEPTTGLDSSTALAVLELLEKIASKGVNVVCTIHQPSSEIFSIFD